MISISATETRILRALAAATTPLTAGNIAVLAGHEMTPARRRRLTTVGFIRVYREDGCNLYEITDEGALWAIGDVQDQVRAAFAALTRDGFAVALADVRERVDGSRVLVDLALERMAGQPGVHIRAEADQKTLTDRDHAAALQLGGVARHTLLIR